MRGGGIKLLRVKINVNTKKVSINFHELMPTFSISICRADDPPEHNYLYGIPAAVFLGSYGYGVMQGYPEIHQMASLAASLCCVGALAGLSSQKTSRLGNNLGMVFIFVFTELFSNIYFYDCYLHMRDELK